MTEDQLVAILADEDRPFPQPEDSPATVLASATAAAIGGLYSYSRVPQGHAPYTGTDYRVVVAGGELEFACHAHPHGVPPGTELHCYNSVTCWRVDTYVLPDGTTYTLTAT